VRRGARPSSVSSHVPLVQYFPGDWRNIPRVAAVHRAVERRHGSRLVHMCSHAR
jgi:hypothetical protein